MRNRMNTTQNNPGAGGATLRHIVSRLLVKAEGAWQESEENIDDLFVQGRRDAYFEILDMLPDDVLVEELNARGW